jgi:hypothetical protein
VASVFAHSTGRYMAGAFWFSPILKIGPYPIPGPPGLAHAGNVHRRPMLAPQALALKAIPSLRDP